ncbi:MAG: NUDIX hydrolase [Phycisphaerae bacterium]|nr:NUDIX hydrolase [Phycisphaerae bacterium]
MAHEWEVRDRRVAFAARRWSVERSVRKRTGVAGDHEFFTIRMPDFVHVIALTEAEELVMVRQFRHGAERVTLEMPGGLVGADEPDVVSAARRELLEETGYDGSLDPLGEVWPNPALLTNRCHFFVGRGVRRVSAPRPEATEDVEVVLVPRGEIRGLIRRGDIGNALMIAGLMRWELWEGERRG